MSNSPIGVIAASGPNSNSTHVPANEDSSSGDEPDVQLQFKVIVLGDGAVGKTSICNRFTSDNFAKTYKQTVGLDFYIKQVVLDSITVALQIWDIGGQAIGSKMIQQYIFGAHAIILAYDITNFESFQNLEDWLGIVKATFKENMPLLALVANKHDLIHLKIVKGRAQTTFAEENHMLVFEVSAKSGDQINACFTRIAAELAGVKLTKNQLETATKIVQAEIVNYQQNDPNEKPISLEEAKGKCTIQ